MNLEIERKFLVMHAGYKEAAVASHRIRQGYLAHDCGRSVRVRIRDGAGILTVKGPFVGLGSRPEWEKELSLEEAEDLFLLCKPGSIDKTRWIVPADSFAPLGMTEGSLGMTGGSRFFEVDEFHGDNEGLMLAEIELSHPDEPFVRPSWLGEEVTGDQRYYNGYLARNPYKGW